MHQLQQILTRAKNLDAGLLRPAHRESLERAVCNLEDEVHAGSDEVRPALRSLKDSLLLALWEGPPPKAWPRGRLGRYVELYRHERDQRRAMRAAMLERHPR